MGLELQAVVGPQTLADGAKALPRLGRSGESVVQHLHGMRYEIVKRGNVFSAATAVAGVDHGSSLATSPPFCLYNPANSGVELSILSATMGYVSGTLGAGVIVYAVSSNPSGTAPTGTAISPVNQKSFSATGSKAQAFTTATVATAPTLLRPAWNVSAELATTALAAFAVKDDANGEILVPEGGFVVLQGVCGAAGTTPRVMFGMTWEEVPV